MGSGGTDKPMSLEEQRRANFSELRLAKNRLEKACENLRMDMPLIIGASYEFGDEVYKLREVYRSDCLLESAFGTFVKVSIDQLGWSKDRC